MYSKNDVQCISSLYLQRRTPFQGFHPPPPSNDCMIIRSAIKAALDNPSITYHRPSHSGHSPSPITHQSTPDNSMKTLIFAVLASMASMTSAFFDIIVGPKFQGCEVICQGDGGLAEGPCSAHPGCHWADNQKKTKKKCWSSVGHLPCPVR